MNKTAGDKSYPAATVAQRAIAVVADAFRTAGWTVNQRTARSDGLWTPDLRVHRDAVSYVVEVKATPGARADWLLPLWSQAYLEANRAADGRDMPLAVVAAQRISTRAAEQVLAFAAAYAPEAAIGVIDLDGLRRFRGRALDGLDADAARPAAWASAASGSTASEAAKQDNLFSDLNQWMLKVLLAPVIPATMLSAPRGYYRNATELARAAGVSVPSAFRLVQQLGRDGFLHESAPDLRLVRRDELLRRWQAWSTVRKVYEVPMRFVLRANAQGELRRVLQAEHACLGLFAAADALGVGFVAGVPPHVYVPRLTRAMLKEFTNAVPAERGGSPDFFLRESPAPKSVLRGLVHGKDSLPTADVLQVWLDVTAHPARGAEQADLIRRRVLGPLFAEHTVDG